MGIERFTWNDQDRNASVKRQQTAESLYIILEDFSSLAERDASSMIVMYDGINGVEMFVKSEDKVISN